MNSKIAYLDNNATTQVDPEVFEAMKPFLKSEFGNPSSLYDLAGTSSDAITTAREQLAKTLGARPDEIIFTSCGTESDNMALASAMSTATGGGKLVTTKVEHAAVGNYTKRLSEEGHTIVELSVDSNGQIDLDELDSALEGATAISIMWANNETGVLFPIPEIAKRAHERGVLVHTDAVQVVGKIPINLSELEIDYLSLSGHKFHAPKGVGALYVRSGSPVHSLVMGGHQEKGRRGGTENVAGIVALGRAIVLAEQHMDDENNRVRAMRDQLETALLESCPNARLNGSVNERLPNTTNISFEFVEGEGILLLLNMQGIAASSGSACTTGSLEPSHVLRAMGVPYTAAHGAVRFSLSRFTTQEEIDRAIEAMPKIIKRLRELSPFGRD